MAKAFIKQKIYPIGNTGVSFLVSQDQDAALRVEFIGSNGEPHPYLFPQWNADDLLALGFDPYPQDKEPELQEPVNESQS